MAKPRLIILIRHAQSEGNKNREIHQTIPDHRVKLTKEGWDQAYDAGRRLRKLLRPSDTLHFFTSPYRRTRETTDGILTTLTADDVDQGASPFKRDNIKVYEEPRLREQDFGNFQPCGAEMERMWQERADYGHFFYRIPNGESAADAYDRVSGFNESMWRQFGEDDFASVCVLVTHGLMSRVFLMKWYHFTVEYFEDLRNVNHCEFLIMRKEEESGKYTLQNKLRTWSGLGGERAAAASREKGEHDGKEPDDKRPDMKLNRTKTFVVTRQWGGCPNGCNHSSHYTKRDDIEALRDADFSGGANLAVNGNGNATPVADGNGTIANRRSGAERIQSYNSDDDPNDTRADHDHDQDHEQEDSNDSGPQIDVTRAHQSDVSSPAGTPSFISAEDRLGSLKSPHLHVGRDFGGTYSGHASLADSDDELSEDDSAGPRKAHHHHHHHHTTAAATVATKISGAPADGNGSALKTASAPHEEGRRVPDERGMRRGAGANRLGDVPHSGGDAGSEGGQDGDQEVDQDGDQEVEQDGEGEEQKTVAELVQIEKEEKSVQGSVY